MNFALYLQDAVREFTKRKANFSSFLVETL